MFTGFFIASLSDDLISRTISHSHWYPGHQADSLPSLQNILQFCFPANPALIQPREFFAPKQHCFTLTGGDARRLHGFCRTTSPHPALSSSNQQLSTQSPRRLPICLTIISPHLWPAFFWKILELLDRCLKAQPLADPSPALLPPYSLPSLLLNQLLGVSSTPAGGTIISLHWPASLRLDLIPMRTAPRFNSYGDVTAEEEGLRAGNGVLELEIPPLIVSPPPPLSISHSSTHAATVAETTIPLSRLLWYVTARQAISILAALLMERRIIFLSSDAEKLTLAAHAATALIRPFTWQHVYLPLLPHALVDYLHAPMPILAGVLSSTFAAAPAEVHENLKESSLIIELDSLGECKPEIGSLQDDALLLPNTEGLVNELEAVKKRLQDPGDCRQEPHVAQALGAWFGELMLDQCMEFVGKDCSAEFVVQSEEESIIKESRGDTDGAIYHNGFVFDWLGFLAAKRLQSEQNVLFLESFRHSQMLEVYLRELLEQAAGKSAESRGGGAEGTTTNRKNAIILDASPKKDALIEVESAIEELHHLFDNSGPLPTTAAVAAADQPSVPESSSWVPFNSQLSAAPVIVTTNSVQESKSTSNQQVEIFPEQPKQQLPVNRIAIDVGKLKIKDDAFSSLVAEAAADVLDKKCNLK